MYNYQNSTLSIIIKVIIIIITTIICLTNQPIQLFSRLFARYHHSNQYNLICVASVGRWGHIAWQTPKATIVLFGGNGDDAKKSAEIVPGEMVCFLPCFVTKYFFHLYPLYWLILYWRMDDDEAYNNASLIFI